MFEALLCNGETFRPHSLRESFGTRGAVLVFGGFVFSAIALNWWARYEQYGWHEFDDVPVYGVYRDGPYAVNEFLRRRSVPFGFFSDVDGDVASAYGLLVERHGMAGTQTAMRAIFVIDSNGSVVHTWNTDEWIYPVPTRQLQQHIESL
jgi:alkyl hydroperoxide reductase subunit AhpC